MTLDKTLIAGRDSASGGFWLFIGKMTSTVLLAVGTIFMGNFISGDDYGLYAIALIPATTMLLFQDWGVGPALTKFCAKYRITHDIDLRSMILAGLTFESITGIALTLLSFMMANFIGIAVFAKPESVFLISIVSITILPLSLLTGIDAILIGFDRMEFRGLGMILRSAVYAALAPLLVYIGYGASGAIVGYVISILAAFAVEMGLLYFKIFRKLDCNKMNKSSLFESLKPLLHFGVPLAIGGLIGGITAQVYSFAMATFVDELMIGNYQIANNFAIALEFLTFPIITVLFPAFSKFNPQKERQDLKKVFAASVKYTSLLVVPASMALMVLSAPIIGTLYGDKWLYAPFFLFLSVTSGLLRLLGNLSMTSLLNGIGETKVVMKLSIITLATGVPAALFLIPRFGIPAYILVSMYANIPAMFVSISWIWKRYRIKLDYQNSAKIFLSSTLAATTTYLFLNVITAADWILFTTGCILFFIIYLIVTPLIGAVNQTDIDNLRLLFSNLTVISRPLELLLKLVEKTLKLRNKQSKMEKQQNFTNY